MTRLALAASLGVAVVLLTGCATTPSAADAPQAQITGPQDLAAYYQQATADHHRAVRKPTRDRQTRALDALAAKTGTLLAASASWDSDVRLAAFAESERPLARTAVSDYRTALVSLRDSAARRDLPAVRTAYARALVAYGGLGRNAPRSE